MLRADQEFALLPGDFGRTRPRGAFYAGASALSHRLSKPRLRRASWASLFLSLIIILVAAILQKHVLAETKFPTDTSFVTLCEGPSIIYYYPQKQLFSFRRRRLPHQQHVFAARHCYVSSYPVVRTNNPERRDFFSALQYASEQETVCVFHPIWGIGLAVTVSGKARPEIVTAHPPLSGRTR
jgi:hypothetical protein